MMIAWMRNPPSHVVTPFGREAITGMFGVSGRRWFFGLQKVRAAPLSVSEGDAAKIGDRTYTAKLVYRGNNGERRVSCSFESATHYGDMSLPEAEFLERRLMR